MERPLLQRHKNKMLTLIFALVFGGGILSYFFIKANPSSFLYAFIVIWYAIIINAAYELVIKRASFKEYDWRGTDELLENEERVVKSWFRAEVYSSTNTGFSIGIQPILITNQRVIVSRETRNGDLDVPKFINSYYFGKDITSKELTKDKKAIIFVFSKGIINRKLEITLDNAEYILNQLAK